MIWGMKLDVLFIRTKEFIIMFNGWLIDFFKISLWGEKVINQFLIIIIKELKNL